MKKIFLLLTLSSVLFSCNSLPDDEFVLEGSVKNVPNGKKVILQRQDPKIGTVPVDTAKVENGKFKFTGKVTEPALYFLAIDDVQAKSFVIVEHGEINIEINKDSVYTNKISGTYNNEQLTEFNRQGLKIQKEIKAFEKANGAKMTEAMNKKDTVTIKQLRTDYQNIQKKMESTTDKYVQDHPKSYISLLLVQSLFNGYQPDLQKIEKYYNAFDADLKKTKIGKEIADKLKAMKAVGVGRPAPEFSAPNPEGKVVTLKESLGKATIIDFWASWCGPCRQENPNVVALYDEFHAKGLNIISVSLDRPGQADKWKEAIAKDKLAWTQVSNLKYWEDPIAASYGVKSIPSTYLLNESGIVVAMNLRGEALKSKVAQLLNAS